jgi:hypothetical protein
VTPKLQASPSSLVLVGWVGHLRAHHTSGEGKLMEAETAKAQSLPPSRCAARPVTPTRRATSYPVIFAEDGQTETLHIAARDRVIMPPRADEVEGRPQRRGRGLRIVRTIEGRGPISGGPVQDWRVVIQRA